MTKYVICNEVATLKEHQRIRAEKALHKRVAQWDGGDILNIVFDGEIQNRIDWNPEIIGVYDTLEKAREVASAQNIKCSVTAYDPGLELVAYYIDEREVLDDETWEKRGMYDIPREIEEEEAPVKEQDIDVFAEYLYRHGYDADDIYKLREIYKLTEDEEEKIYSTLQSMHNIDEWILKKYYGHSF